MALPGLECFGNVKRDVKRFAAVYVPNGINMHHGTPSQQGDLIDIPDALSPMESYRDSLQVISGLTHDKARANGDGAGDHARACSTFLTGKQANKHESKITNNPIHIHTYTSNNNNPTTTTQQITS